MIHLWENHIGKRTVWTLIYFLIYAYSNILAQSQILVIRFYIHNFVICEIRFIHLKKTFHPEIHAHGFNNTFTTVLLLIIPFPRLMFEKKKCWVEHKKKLFSKNLLNWAILSLKYLGISPLSMYLL